MKKLKSTLLAVLFLFPFLAFTNAAADEKKVVAVKLVSNFGEKYYIICVKKDYQKTIEFIKNFIKKKIKNKVITFDTYYLSSDKIDNDFNLSKDSKMPKFLSKEEVENIFKDKNDFVEFSDSDLFGFSQDWDTGEIAKYDEEKKSIDYVKKEDFFKKNAHSNKDVPKKDNDDKSNKKKDFRHFDFVSLLKSTLWSMLGLYICGSVCFSFCLQVVMRILKYVPSSSSSMGYISILSHIPTFYGMLWFIGPLSTSLERWLLHILVNCFLFWSPFYFRSYALYLNIFMNLLFNFLIRVVRTVPFEHKKTENLTKNK